MYMCQQESFQLCYGNKLWLYTTVIWLKHFHLVADLGGEYNGNGVGYLLRCLDSSHRMCYLMLVVLEEVRSMIWLVHGLI